MNLAIQPFSHFSASVARVRRYKNLIITITITLEQDSEGGIAQLAQSPRLLMMMLMY